MSQQSFADLGVSDAVVRALAARDVTVPFDVQRSVVPDVLAGHDVLVQSPTGSGKTLAFGVPGGPRPGRGREGEPPSCSCRRVGSRARSPRTCGRSPKHGRSRWLPSTAAPASSARRDLPEGRTSWWPHPAAWRTSCSAAPSDSIPSACWSSTRPTGCSTWASARPSIASSRSPPRDRQTLFFSATLEGATGRSPPPSRATRAATSSRRASAPRGAWSTASSPSPTSPSSTRWSTSWPPASAGARWCSCAPSAAPTGSSSASRATASTRWRSTATGRSPSARRRSAASTPATSTRWSPPTWRPAASTWTTSRT